jgi:hypothetical protein
VTLARDSFKAGSFVSSPVISERIIEVEGICIQTVAGQEIINKFSADTCLVSFKHFLAFTRVYPNVSGLIR